MSTNPSIPFADLKTQYAGIRESVQRRMNAVLEGGAYIMGPEVAESEQALRELTGSAHCITVSSGTEALLIALMANNVGSGDEVITTPFSFAATAEVIALVGAKPVFVDIEPDTYNIDASLIEAAITENTRAIIPVSLYGQPADMHQINTIAAKHGDIPVIEDAAQSFGSMQNGKPSGNLSQIGCTSFFPSKPLGCYGDGGAIFTNDDTLATACREIRVHGQSARYLHTRVGVGGRMDALQCAVILAKLEKFSWEVQERDRIAKRYTAAIDQANIDARTLSVREDRTCVWAQYTVAVKNRDQVVQTLKAAGVPTAIHYPKPLHHQPAYAQHCCPECCPNSQTAANEVMSLPMSAYLSEAHQDIVVEQLIKAVI